MGFYHIAMANTKPGSSYADFARVFAAKSARARRRALACNGAQSDEMLGRLAVVPNRIYDNYLTQADLFCAAARSTATTEQALALFDHSAAIMHGMGFDEGSLATPTDSLMSFGKDGKRLKPLLEAARRKGDLLYVVPSSRDGNECRDFGISYADILKHPVLGPTLFLSFRKLDLGTAGIQSPPMVFDDSESQRSSFEFDDDGDQTYYQAIVDGSNIYMASETEGGEEYSGMGTRIAKLDHDGVELGEIKLESCDVRSMLVNGNSLFVLADVADSSSVLVYDKRTLKKKKTLGISAFTAAKKSPPLPPPLSPKAKLMAAQGQNLIIHEPGEEGRGGFLKLFSVRPGHNTSPLMTSQIDAKVDAFAVDLKNQRLYFAYGNEVLVYNTSAKKVGRFKLPGVIGSPEKLFVAADGSLIVTEINSSEEGGPQKHDCTRISWRLLNKLMDEFTIQGDFEHIQNKVPIMLVPSST